MSIDALSWAFNLDLPNSGVKLTLLALANYANDEHSTAYPNQKTISQKTCLSTRAIRTHLVTLETLGVISRVSRKREDGTFTSDLFTLNVGFCPSKTCGRNYQRQNLPTAKNNKIQRQNLPNPAAESAYQESSLNTTKTNYEPQIESVADNQIKPGLAGAFCKTMMRYGVQGCNPHHPTLLALIHAGAIEQEFAEAAQTAVRKGKPSFAYAVGIVKRQREEAAALVLHQGRMPTKQDLLVQENKESTLRAKARLFGSPTEKDVTNETTRL